MSSVSNLLQQHKDREVSESLQNEACIILEGLLTVDPGKRWTCDDILEQANFTLCPIEFGGEN